MKLTGFPKIRWEMKVIKCLQVGELHVGQLHWIHVGKHKPCLITNHLFWVTVGNLIVLDLGRSRGGVCQIIVFF